MTFLPIVQRELLEASRRRATYWSRVGAAGAALAIGIWVMMFPEFRTPSRMGMALFVPVAVIALIYCALAGVFRTADCLSEEKREGTLGLLFLTDLRGHDIVLGKLAATSLNSIYGLLALFPILAVPLLAGGVAAAELARVALVAANTLFFSLAAGMFCSAASRDERRSMAATFGLLLLFIPGLPIAAGILADQLRPRPAEWVEWIAIPSPGYAAVYAFEDLRRGQRFASEHFFASIAIVHALAWAFLAAASFLLPRTWQDRRTVAPTKTTPPATGAGSTPGPGFRGPAGAEDQVSPGTGDRPASAVVARRALLDLNPLLWLVTRGRFKLLKPWIVPALGALLWTWGLLKHPTDWKNEFAYVLTALAAHTLLKFLLVTEACRHFSHDRQSGALELLLSTPLSVREIVHGQVLGLERQFAGPVFVVLLADLAFLMAERHTQGWVSVWAVGMIVFVADLWTLGWLGMWLGLIRRHPNRAALGALFRVLVLPWILFALVMTVLGVSGGLRMMNNAAWENYGLPLLYAGLSLGVNLVFGLPARQRLLAEFRTVATQRFDSKGRSRD